MTLVQSHLPPSTDAPVPKRKFKNTFKNTFKLKSFSKLVNAPLMKYLTWLAVALVIAYRLLAGQTFILGICILGGAGCLLLHENWKSIPKKHRSRVVFGSGVVLSWAFMTLHAPADALFFNTIETALTTIFKTFNVTGADNIPKWIGGVFRIIAIVFLGIIGLRFGRQRDEDEEGIKHLVARIVPWIAGLLILDALVELVIQ
jgi:hypothetical protein